MRLPMNIDEKRRTNPKELLRRKPPLDFINLRQRKQ